MRPGCRQRPAHAPEGSSHAWHIYNLRLNADAPVARDRFIELMAAAGVGTSVHFIPLHLQPYWRDRYALRAADFPASQQAYEQMLSLPVYSRMTDADADRVIAAVRGLLAPA